MSNEISQLCLQEFDTQNKKNEYELSVLVTFYLSS